MRYNSAKIYGSTSYGGSPVYGTSSQAVSTVDPLLALQNLLDFLHLFVTALDRFYLNVSIANPFTANIAMIGSLPLNVYVRVLWTKNNPGRIFDPSKDINELKELYLSMNRDWRTDTYIVTSEMMRMREIVREYKE